VYEVVVHRLGQPHHVHLISVGFGRAGNSQAGIRRVVAANVEQIPDVVGLEDAKKALDTLPLVKAGLISFELMPLVPYPGFARLFV
jgi:hypothetical protein